MSRLQPFGVCPARRCPGRCGSPASLQRFENGQGEVGLKQDLTARQGDPSARIAVEVGVALDDLEHLVHRHLLAGDAHGVVRACLHAVPAHVAQVAVDDDAVGADGDGPERARRHAAVAALAEGLPVHEFRREVLRLRVGAPHAAQRAALEEDGRPDARTVVDAVPLDVEHGPCNACHCRSLLARIRDRERRRRRRSGTKVFAQPTSCMVRSTISSCSSGGRSTK